MRSMAPSRSSWTNSSVFRRAFAFLSLLSVLSGPAAAHPGRAVDGGFGSGVLHPLTGADHALMALAVGTWVVLLGRRYLWLLPVAFLTAMTAGYIAALFEVPVLALEPMIAVSWVSIGLAAAYAVRVPLWASAVLVSVFAAFHGLAHGAEMPLQASVVAYLLGLLSGTGAVLVLPLAVASTVKSILARRVQLFVPPD